MPRPLLAAAVLVLGCLPALAGPAEDASRLVDLTRSYHEAKDGTDWGSVRARRDALAAIAALDSAESVPLLYEAFSADPVISCRAAAMRGLGRVGSLPVLKAVAAAAVRDPSDVFRHLLPNVLGDSKDPHLGPWLCRALLPIAVDHVTRAVLVETLGRLRCPEALPAIRSLLASDEHDQRTRCEALIALGRIGGEASFEEIAGHLTDPDRVVRQAAVRALAETGHPSAAGTVLPLASDEAPGVREAVAEVLRRCREPQGDAALIEMLAAGPRRVREAAREALVARAGVDFGLAPGPWRAWRAGAVPTAPVLPPPALTFHGLPVASDRFLILLDTSVSMLAGLPSRMTVARSALRGLLSSVNHHTLFNVAAFGAAPRWWRDREAAADPDAVRSALDFAEGLPVHGGANLFDTLAEAFVLNRLADTVYIVTDGCPSFGLLTDDEEMLAGVAAVNRFRRVRIHCAVLLIGEPAALGLPPPGPGFAKNLLAARAFDPDEAVRFYTRLATENGGRCVIIDR